MNHDDRCLEDNMAGLIRSAVGRGARPGRAVRQRTLRLLRTELRAGRISVGYIKALIDAVPSGLVMVS